MSAAQLERLQEQMQWLRLFKSRKRLEALLQDTTAKEATYADFLDTLLAEEIASKTAKHVTMRTHLARFPFVKSLETFDFSYQPSLDKKQIQTLSSCHFIEHGENVVFLGPPGVGKSCIGGARFQAEGREGRRFREGAFRQSSLYPVFYEAAGRVKSALRILCCVSIVLSLRCPLASRGSVILLFAL